MKLLHVGHSLTKLKVNLAHCHTTRRKARHWLDLHPMSTTRYLPVSKVRYKILLRFSFFDAFCLSLNLFSDPSNLPSFFTASYNLNEGNKNNI